jgi:hypothetical protein
MSKKIICELSRLPQIHEQNLGLAVFESWPKKTVDCLGGGLGHQPHIVGGIRQLDKRAVRILRLLRVEHACPDAHADLFAQRILSPQFFGSALRVSGHGFFDRLDVGQSVPEHPTAADLLLWRVSLLQLQARCAGELTRSFLDHNTEFLPKRPCISLGEIHRGLDTHAFEVRFHPLAHTPNVSNVSVTQCPLTLGLIAEINDSASLFQQPFCRVICQLGEGLCASNPYANGDARLLENGRSQLAAKSS